MDLLKNLIKEPYRKINSSNSNFCGTPLGNTRELTERVARTILLGKGDADKLLKTTVGKDKQSRQSDDE